MEGSDAIEGLRRSEAALREYAERRNLKLTSEIPWPGYQPAELQTGPIRHAIWSLSGELPGGAIGRLRHQAVFGGVMGMDVAGQHTIMVCRQPESVGYVPMLCIRPKEFGSGLYYWGGDNRPRDSQEFESTELSRRFVVEIAEGQGQNWLWQLFSPTLVNWIAHETPPDFGFKLETGVFTCEVPQWRGQASDGEVDPAYLDLLAESGGKVAGRIRDEVLEEVGTGSASAPDSIEAYARWVSAPTHGRLVGALLKLVGGDRPDDSVVRWAERNGMKTGSPAAFHARHITLPLPGTAGDVATGTLPGSELPGSVAWISYSSPVDVEQNYVAVVADVGGDHEPAWIDAAEMTAPGAAGPVPGELIAGAREGGWGLSAAAGSLCLYLRGPGPAAWPSGAEIDAFVPRAAELIARAGPSADA